MPLSVGPSKALVENMHVAAAMRARGAKWAEVAGKLGYVDGDSALRCLAGEHKTLWKEIMGAAGEEVLFGDAEPLAVDFQMSLVRRGKALLERGQLSEQEVEEVRIAESAAHSLQTHVAKLRAQQINVDLTVGQQKRQVDDRIIEEAERQANDFAHQSAERLLLAGVEEAGAGVEGM